MENSPCSWHASAALLLRGTAAEHPGCGAVPEQLLVAMVELLEPVQAARGTRTGCTGGSHCLPPPGSALHRTDELCCSAEPGASSGTLCGSASRDGRQTDLQVAAVTDSAVQSRKLIIRIRHSSFDFLVARRGLRAHRDLETQKYLQLPRSFCNASHNTIPQGKDSSFIRAGSSQITRARL